MKSITREVNERIIAEIYRHVHASKGESEKKSLPENKITRATKLTLQ